MDLKTPGVYIQESDSDPPPIEGVDTSVAGFVGVTERGPAEPTAVESWRQFEEVFGSASDPRISFLPHAVRGYFENGGRRLYVARVLPAAEDERPGPPSAASILGTECEAGTTGLRALEEIEEVALVCVPDAAHPALPAADRGRVIDAVVDQCERLGDRFAVLQVERGGRDVSALQPPTDTSYAAIYHPWVEVTQPEDAGKALIPPTGHVAGAIARNDRDRGVNKSPANIELRGVSAPERSFTDAEQEILNPRGINLIREFPGRGIRIWGARTTSSDPEWNYLAVRRFAIFVEQSIGKGTQWAVFEPNDQPLWTRLRQAIGTFLHIQWQNGAMRGQTPDKAYFVRVGLGDTMTQSDIDNGRVIAHVGFAPLKPAEFVVLRIEWALQCGG